MKNLEIIDIFVWKYHVQKNKEHVNFFANKNFSCEKVVTNSSDALQTAFVANPIDNTYTLYSGDFYVLFNTF